MWPHSLADPRQKIAAALDADPERVRIEHGETDLSGWVWRCTGSCGTLQFFAKVYLLDFNPPIRRIPAFVVPWEELRLLRQEALPFGGQVESEWNAITRLNRLIPDHRIPAPMGKSVEHGTLVFEAVSGTRMDHRVHWAGWSRTRARSNARVVFEAGTWLRRVHEATFERTESVDVREVARTIQQILRIQGVEHTRYGGLALRSFASVSADLASRGKLDVPLCLQHGDFTLPNLIWDDRVQRLWIIDLEHSRPATVLQDLASLILNLRSRYVYPFTSRSVVMALEDAFWNGYGETPRETRALANAIATACIFYKLLPKLLTRGARRGRLAGLAAAIYRSAIEPSIVRRILANSRPPVSAPCPQAALVAD